MLQYYCSDGWYVLSGSPDRIWRIGLILGNLVTRTKKIGPVKMKGKNYFDAACAECRKRNEKQGYKTESSIPKSKHI